jgi:predicted dehydrogenase
MDLMVHDIDLALAMAGSPVRKVDATGLSILGGHEDVANARLEFESGCVAVLSASRVSYEPVRRMQAWADRAFAAVDFAARTTTLVRPSETLLRRQFHVDELTPEQIEHYRKHFAEEHLPRLHKQFGDVDALMLELQDFVESIRSPRQPRVNGAAGRDAVAVAERILACIHAGQSSREVEPVEMPAMSRPSTVPAPHFDLSSIAAASPASRREAG